MQKFPRQSAKEFFSKGISIIIRRKRSYIKTLEPRLTLFLENQTPNFQIYVIPNFFPVIILFSSNLKFYHRTMQNALYYPHLDENTKGSNSKLVK